MIFPEVKDRIGRSLLLLFLVKPTVDLFYWIWVPVGGFIMTPVRAFGGLVFFYFIFFWFQRGRHIPPYGKLFAAFILLNVISILIGLAMTDYVKPIRIINFGLRVGDAYLIYCAAFLFASRSSLSDVTPFVKAILIGSSIAVILNFAAVQFGFSLGAKAGTQATLGSIRERGLYYDPGGLGNFAFANLVFATYMLHLLRRKTAVWIAFCVFLVLADLYLIQASKSRAVFIEVAIFGMIYLWMFQQRAGKVIAPVVTVILLGTSILVFDVDVKEVFVRFEGDLAALESAMESGQGAAMDQDGDVSLGALEGLGNNRLALWANAINIILDQWSPIELLVGNFAPSMAHSDYVDVLGRNGIVGFVLYLLLIFGLLFKLWRLARKAPQGRARTTFFIAFTLLACYAFYSMPFRPLSYTTTAWYMWTMIAFSFAISQRSVRRTETARKKTAQTRPRKSLVMQPVAGRGAAHRT